MIFDDNFTLKEFAILLIKNLEDKEEYVLKEELIGWLNCSYTSSSEFLGELNLILKKVKNFAALDQKTRNNVIDCIAAIDEVFK